MEVFDYFDYLGCFAFAISGALSAMNKRFDPFGVFILASVTAIGGGSLRDMLLGRTPVGWMLDNNYMYLILVATILAMLFRSKLSYFRRTFFLFDSIGLATFTITGVQLGLQYELNTLICILLGTMSAAFGGLIRDLLSNEIPVILHQEIYASASILGGVLYLVLLPSGLSEFVLYSLVTLFILILRILAVQNHWHLPKFYKEIN